MEAREEHAETLHVRADCPTLHSSSVRPTPVGDEADWCDVCSGDVDGEPNALVHVNPNTHITGSGKTVHARGDCRYVREEAEEKSVGVYPPGHIRWCKECAGTPKYGEAPAAIVCDSCGDRVGVAVAVDGHCLSCTNESEPELHADGGSETTPIYLHREPNDGAISDHVFVSFGADGLGAFEGPTGHSGIEWVETQVLAEFDEGGRLDDVLYTEAQRQLHGEDPPQVGVAEFDRSAREIVDVDLDPEALDGHRELVADGSGCFYCALATDRHPQCDRPGCTNDVHGHGPDGKHTYSYCTSHRSSEEPELRADGGTVPRECDSCEDPLPDGVRYETKAIIDVPDGGEAEVEIAGDDLCPTCAFLTLRSETFSDLTDRVLAKYDGPVDLEPEVVSEAEPELVTDGGRDVVDVSDVGLPKGEGTPMEEATAEPSTPGDRVGPLTMTAFQQNLLVILSEKPRYGLAIKRELESYYDEEVNHGRLYPNLDDLVDEGLVAKSELDKRTNQYELTDAGEEVVRDRLRWVLSKFVTDPNRVDDVHDLLGDALDGNRGGA